MLRLFFHRDAYLVRLMETLGVVGLLGFLGGTRHWHDWHGLEIGITAFCVVNYLILRYCGSRHWYPRVRGIRYPQAQYGIEIHMKKLMVFNAYAIALTAAWLWLSHWPLPLLLLNIAWGFNAVLHGILLYFHFTDRSPTPINMFSARPPATTDVPAKQVAA